MMNCPGCNTLNSDSALFCRDCGRPLADNPQPPAGTDLLLAQPATLPLSNVTTQVSELDLLIGTVFDNRYRIDGKLGSGGMGAVYRGTRLLIGDEVAIKLLQPKEVAQHQSIERFQREAQAAARLKHANAVNVYDFGVSSEGIFYLVMELVKGESVRTIIKRRGPFTLTAAAEVVTQVGAALDEAHRQQILHRDIKPDNIMVQPTIDGLRVKVLDFGIAKLSDDDANLTQTGSVMGTPHYMSPEQCLGEELDSRSDVYSLGVVLYEMLAGVVPFNSPTSTAVVIQHVNQPPPPLHSLNPAIPAGVETVVLRALEKRRELRPSSAGALASELNSAVHPSSATTIGNPSVPLTMPASAVAPFSGEQATLVMNPAAAGAGSYPSPPPIPPSPAHLYLSGPQPVVKRNRTLPLVLGAIALVAVGIVVTLLLLPSRTKRAPLPDHFGLFVRKNEALNELRRGEFRDLMKARETLMSDPSLPQVEAKPTLILYSEGTDIPLNELKLVQLDTLDASGKVAYWNYQVSPVDGQAGMRQLRVASGLPSGRYAFAVINGFMDEGNHRFWPFQVNAEGQVPTEAAQVAQVPLKPKPAPLPTSGPTPTVVVRPTAPVPPPSGASVAYANTSNLLVRRSNSLTGTPIAKLSLNQRVYVLQLSSNYDIWNNIRSNWALVQLENSSVQGWVFAALLRR